MIYLIPGLGADHRIFKFIDLTPLNTVCVSWPPIARKETMESYIEKLLKQINGEQEVILIGVSFGGILAIELSKKIKCRKVVIISSVKSSDELPILIKLLKYLPIHKFIPPQVLKYYSKKLLCYFFSVTAKSSIKLLEDILKETDTDFMKWAINIIVNWNTDKATTDLLHIHGMQDRIFPYSNIKDSVGIEGGGHFMVVDKAEEVKKVILSHL